MVRVPSNLTVATLNYLAQPNADSYFGNLLGDFGGTRHVKNLPLTVKKALDNHYLVDKFIDNHTKITDTHHN